MARILRQGLGALLLVFGLFPIYRALDTGGDAPFRIASVEIAETTLEFVLSGVLLVVLLAVLLTFLLKDGAVRLGKAVTAGLLKPRLPLFAVVTGFLAFGLSLCIAVFLYQGLYTNMDEIASAVQARYMAAGRISGPDLALPEAWLVTNTLMAAEGWVSQYPPSHLGIMALFFRLGAPVLTGPVLMGIMAWLVTLSFPRLLPDHPGTARWAGLLTAVSPFLLFLAGGALSHLTAGAAGAAVFYAALRARDGRPEWALAMGASVGVMVCARPLVGLVLGAAIPLFLWVPRLRASGFRWGAVRVVGTILGGLPFALFLGLYNHRLFGAWSRFGYIAAFGDNHKLGFHLDPWGNLYGIGSAIAFTAMDLLALGVQLLETPLPLTLAIGGFLLLGPRLPRGSGVIMAWAFLPLLANVFYWFHSSRMMFEAAPAWILLAVLGIREIVAWSETSGRGPLTRRAGEAVAWAVVVSLTVAAGWGVATRWRTYAWTQETLERIRVPDVPVDGPSLVFVHTSWNERLSARLQGAGGMRQDSIVSVLRRNTNCSLQVYADAREARARGWGGQGELPPVDLEQTAATPMGIVHAAPVEGMTVRTREGEVMGASCAREIQADRFGAVALAPLLWQGDLPGLPAEGPLFVRDLGPEANHRVIGLFPERPAFVFSPRSISTPPEIIPFEEAMRVLWGDSP